MELQRLIGDIRGRDDGPLMIIVACMHGNETVGLRALQLVLQKIQLVNITIKGRLVGLVGNLSATSAGKRYVDYDLNRAWDDKKILEAAKSEASSSKMEDRELLELHETINDLLKNTHRQKKYIIDLHATSSDNGNFIVVPEKNANDPIVKSLHLPVVIDLEKYLRGTMMSYFQNDNLVSLALEGGLISSKEAEDLHESGIWEVLEAAGMITHHDHREIDHYENKLRAVAAFFPKKVKVVYRHWIEEKDGFVMRPGYKNFDKVAKGAALANDKHGIVCSPSDGMIFMPLYQPSGNDGFFIVEEIS